MNDMRRDRRSDEGDMDEATIAALLRFACRESGRPAGAVSAHPALAPARRRRGTGFSGSWIVDALAVAACAMLALTLLRSLERERDKEPVGGGDDAVIAAEGDTPADPPAGGDQSSVEQAAARADVVAWLSFRSLPLSERDEAERIKADPGTVKEITYAYVPVERVLKGEVDGSSTALRIHVDLLLMGRSPLLRSRAGEIGHFLFFLRRVPQERPSPIGPVPEDHTPEIFEILTIAGEPFVFAPGSRWVARAETAAAAAAQRVRIRAAVERAQNVLRVRIENALAYGYWNPVNYEVEGWQARQVGPGGEVTGGEVNFCVLLRSEREAAAGVPVFDRTSLFREGGEYVVLLTTAGLARAHGAAIPEVPGEGNEIFAWLADSPEARYAESLWAARQERERGAEQSQPDAR